MVIERGIWLITFKDGTINKYWIGSSNNVANILNSKLSQMHKYASTRKYSNLPESIKDIILEHGYESIESIHVITSEFYEYSKLKYLISKTLNKKRYEIAVPSHNAWMYRNKEYDDCFAEFARYSKEKIKVYKACNTEYETCKDYKWTEDPDFIQSKLLLHKNIATAINDLHFSKNKVKMKQLLEIECILRDTIEEELIKTLISEKAYKLYELSNKER